MRFSIATIAAVALFIGVQGAPVRRQGAGVGAGCNSIFSDTDTMIGESTRGQGKNIANAIPRGLYARQGAGVGAGCDSIFSDTDTMIGESTRGAGKSLANDINTRQLNGIADGVTAPLSKSSATSQFGSNTDAFLNTVDGQGTDDSAEAGAIVGDEELSIGKTVGGQNGQSGQSAPPPHKRQGDLGSNLEGFAATISSQSEADLDSIEHLAPQARQLNGIADGVTAPLSKSTYTSQLGSNTDAFLNTVDGQGTDDSAEAGQIVGDEELSIGQTVGGSNGQNGGTGGGNGGQAPPPPPAKGKGK